MIAIFKSHTGDQVMVDSNAEIAFGPVFGSDENPQDFLDWLEGLGYIDVSSLLRPSEIGAFVSKWRKEVESENEASAERYYSDTARTTLDEVCEKAKKLK